MNAPALTEPVSTGLSSRVATVTAEWLDGFASPATRRGYAADLGLSPSAVSGGRAWLPWLHVAGLNPLVARPVDVRRWVGDLVDAGYATGTITRALAAVRSWYRHLDTVGLVAASPAASVRPGELGLHLARTSPTVALSAEHTAALLVAADRLRGPAAARHAAAAALLFTLGLRVGELCGLSLTDVSERAGHRVLRVRGKGGHERRVALPPPAETRLRAYLAGRSDLQELALRHATGPRGEGPLLATRTGRAITPHAVFRLLRRLAADAALPADIRTRITPHVARHTVAELARAAGHDLDAIRQLLGHASLTTTQRYLHGSGEHVGTDVAALLTERWSQ